jgi:hypothetical protein
MDIELYLVLSQDIKTCFHNNSLGLKDIFKREQLDVKLEYSHNLSSGNDSERDKEIIPKIIASSMSLVLILTSLTSLLDEIYRKPYIFEFYENQELRDSKGNIVFGENGDPIMKLIKKNELVQPRKEEIEKEISFNLNLKQGILVKLREVKK